MSNTFSPSSGADAYEPSNMSSSYSAPPAYSTESSISSGSSGLTRMDAYGILTLFFAIYFPIIAIFTGWKSWKDGDSDFSRTLGKWGFILSLISIIFVILYIVFIFIIIFSGILTAGMSTS